MSYYIYGTFFIVYVFLGSGCDVVCLNASWISHEDDGNGAWLTVELRHRVDDVLPPGYGVWIGFGFSHSGTMCGSDLTTAYVSLSDGRLRVEDRYGNASGRPVIIDQAVSNMDMKGYCSVGDPTYASIKQRPRRYDAFGERNMYRYVQ